MGNDPAVRVSIMKVIRDKTVTAEDVLASEEPMEIQLVYGETESMTRKIISVTMRTPGNDEELGAGFLFTEGILNNSDQISEIKSEGNYLRVKLKKNEIPVLQKSDRNFYTTSSCGVCGKSGIEAIGTVSVFKNLKDNISIKSDLLFCLTDKLKDHQTIFESTGGLHASALFDNEGNFLMLREDVGRHNALDKIIGSAFLNGVLPLNDKILLLSGRASFELIQKSVMAGIKIVAAVGAPSSLAVEMAKDSGITLIGFLKYERFNIYSGSQRINTI